MPLRTHQHLSQGGELGIWEITEPEAWFRDQLLLQPAELRQLSGMKGRRRTEWLAVRQLVHQMSGRKERGAFVKDEHGKPHLADSPWHISISHSHGYAAAIASPHLCGIDIQFLVPKITRLGPRFMGQVEQDSIQPANEMEQLHLYWGAKEALYKAHGRRHLDFKEHIFITPPPFYTDTGLTLGEVRKEEEHLRFHVHYEMSKVGYMLVWALEI